MSANHKVGLIAWCAFMAFVTVAAATSNLGPRAPILKLHCESRP